jgi:RimJ/RimL family protein N-acetyltransferase
MERKYIIRTKRLGLRNWSKNDIPEMAKINSDPEVMKYFPSTYDLEQTKSFVKRMSGHCKEFNYCYFAVDLLETNAFIGFVGLMYQDYKADFTPCIDIGWRLSKYFWGKGYATEAAQACIDYAFNVLDLSKLICVAPVINDASIQVMKKIGMTHKGNFDHPLLINEPEIKECALYEISK